MLGWATPAVSAPAKPYFIWRTDPDGGIGDWAWQDAVWLGGGAHWAAFRWYERRRWPVLHAEDRLVVWQGFPCRVSVLAGLNEDPYRPSIMHESDRVEGG